MLHAVTMSLAFAVAVQVPVVPTYDAHQHLRSETAAARVSLVRKTITLPPDLASFLNDRVRFAQQKDSLAKLYLPGATLLQSFEPEFVRTADSIASWWAGATDSPYRLIPVSFDVTGSTASLAAYLADNKSGKVDAHMLYGLTRVRSSWRISSEVLTMGAPYKAETITADYLVGVLDSARIRKAVVLSLGYQFRTAASTRAENEWTASEVARYPDRLVAVCSVNPLMDYALDEVKWCAADRRFRALKLHIGNSRVDLTNEQHLYRLRAVFATANSSNLPIIIHLAPFGTEYGARAARNFLDVLRAAPDIPVQVAHLGSPGRLDERSDSTLAVLTEAIMAKDSRTRNLWFDIATVATPKMTAANAALVVQRLREIGVARILYGSDTADADHLAPREGWAAVVEKLPLTRAELEQIARNEPPYVRDR